MLFIPDLLTPVSPLCTKQQNLMDGEEDWAGEEYWVIEVFPPNPL
jgi:hypothetical protein